MRAARDFMSPKAAGTPIYLYSGGREENPTAFMGVRGGSLFIVSLWSSLFGSPTHLRLARCGHLVRS